MRVSITEPLLFRPFEDEHYFFDPIHRLLACGGGTIKPEQAGRILPGFEYARARVPKCSKFNPYGYHVVAENISFNHYSESGVGASPAG